MNKEIQFEKYEKRSADYHYQQINKGNLRKFNAFTEARYIKHINLIKKHLKILSFNKQEVIDVLDVGCGDGVLLYLLNKHLRKYKFNIHGVDLSEKALEVAKNKIPGGNFIKTDIYNSTFQENNFDLIISSDVIEHVNHPDKMLVEIKRVAKKNALIIIGTPIKYTEKPLDRMHVKEFFQQEFIKITSEYFNFVELEESHKQIQFLKYIKQSKLLKIRINRYLFNLICVFRANPFLDKIKKTTDFPTYMFSVCKN